MYITCSNIHAQNLQIHYIMCKSDGFKAYLRDSAWVFFGLLNPLFRTCLILKKLKLNFPINNMM